MRAPTTITGHGLAGFLFGLLPETQQFNGQIIAIEDEAKAQERERLLAAFDKECSEFLDHLVVGTSPGLALSYMRCVLAEPVK